MIIPYSHRAALAQMPVTYYYKGESLLIYPLRLRDVLALDSWLQSRFVKEYYDRVDLVPEEERKEFVDQLGRIIAGISSQSDTGHRLLWGNSDAMCYLVHLLTRGEWTEERAAGLFFPTGVTPEAQMAIMEMRDSVWRETPEAPKLNITEKPPKYQHTPEELDARVYHAMASKYQWTYDQTLDLTDYQVFWYSYMFPEEREHYEEMDAMANKRPASGNNGRPDVPYQPGTIHFSSPEEYEAWKAKRAKAAVGQ